ncbi:MAG: hypothetical protein HY898_06885 [Deltaproteobacteria bacterium]|nr:hypothetical protein [Deltaproteobacteria bacterium]
MGSRISPMLMVAFSSLLMVLATTTGCGGDPDKQTQPPGASTLELRLPDSAGPLQRPATRFDHALHTDALESEGCAVCHDKGGTGAILGPFLTLPKNASRDELMDSYHHKCTGCHQERARRRAKAGPQTCGDCHVARQSLPVARTSVSFDASLHQRHASTPGFDCNTCHHVFDEGQQKLVYRKGEESACAYCHGGADDGKKLSLRHAVHTTCVGCHLERLQKRLSRGPVQCVGCHEPSSISGIAKLKSVQRMERGQKDSAWIKALDAEFPAVGFDHAAHEPLAASCSSCHHHKLAACETCHPPTGKPEGGYVGLERAYHQGDSERTCVGCHLAKTRTGDCAGCHARPGAQPSQSSCSVCHNGPASGVQEPDRPPTQEVVLQPLASFSEAFPENVTIGLMSHDYKPAVVQHGRIVARLDGIARRSKLAMRFHRTTESLCAGCHHHTPPGMRPPPCSSCHALDEKTGDKPGLRSAYHQQCMGCHERMGIAKVGCTDCHARVGTEEKR